jgi:rhodanese-related sulfurtransferase
VWFRVDLRLDDRKNAGRMPSLPVARAEVFGDCCCIEGDMDNNLEIAPSELKQSLDRGDKILLIDVREPWEFGITSIAGAKLIPMGSIPANLQTLDSEDPVVCYCHHGMRSLDVTVWLRAQGVENVRSLAGGIDRWSLEIDRNVPRY